MTRLYLVRHGRAAAGWNTDPDPGLDDIGRTQAAGAASRLASIGPLPIVTSPLQRCRETAAEGVAMTDRIEWLRTAMRGTWADLGQRYTDYRDGVVAALTALAGDTVVFSHFIAINAAIGAATGDDRLVARSLDNCSITIVDVHEGALQLVESGHEADTLIR
jgi:broad specificity phosphatase PhoE